MNGKRTGKSMKTKPSGQFNPSINRLVSFILSVSILLTVAAPFAEPQVIEANWVTRTIGALITSLALQSGAANIDTKYLNYVNDPNNTVMQIEIPNDGGVTSLPADLASQIDTALQSAPVGVQRTVADMTTTQADIISLQDYIQNNGTTAGDPLPQMQPATAGQNIAASAQQLQETGSVQPAIGGQAVGAFAGMAPTVWNWLSSTRNATMYQGELLNLYNDGQITEQQLNDALFRYDNKLLQKYKTANAGVSVNASNTLLSNLYANGSTAIFTNSKGQYCYYSFQPGLRWTVYHGYGDDYIRVYNSTSSSLNYSYYFGERQDLHGSVSVYGNSYVNIGIRKNSGINSQIFDNESEANAYLTSSDYENQQQKSPSIVGANGQLTANVNVDPTLNLNYYTTNQAPTYNYNNYSMEPIDLNEYTQFAQSIQQQIASDIPQVQISEAIEQYVSQHLVAAPIPTAPPVVPDQPIPDPKPTGTPEQQQENQEIMATPELKDKFPFCIPWDVYYAFAVLEDEREAPALDFDLDLGPAGTHHIEIDFADWEDIASLLRLLELLAFIIGLAIATKRLMGGTGA